MSFNVNLQISWRIQKGRRRDRTIVRPFVIHFSSQNSARLISLWRERRRCMLTKRNKILSMGMLTTKERRRRLIDWWRCLKRVIWLVTRWWLIVAMETTVSQEWNKMRWLNLTDFWELKSGRSSWRSVNCHTRGFREWEIYFISGFSWFRFTAIGESDYGKYWHNSTKRESKSNFTC